MFVPLSFLLSLYQSVWKTQGFSRHEIKPECSLLCIPACYLPFLLLLLEDFLFLAGKFHIPLPIPLLQATGLSSLSLRNRSFRLIAKQFAGIIETDIMTIPYRPCPSLYACARRFMLLIRIFIAMKGPIPHRSAPKISHISTVVPFSEKFSPYLGAFSDSLFPRL